MLTVLTCSRMVDKLHDYQGCLGRLHTLRDRCKARWDRHKEATEGKPWTETVKSYLKGDPNHAQQQDYSHIYRSVEQM